MAKTKNVPTQPNKAETGRPTIRTDETRTAILQAVMMGMSLRQICECDDMPSRRSVTLWLAEDDSFSRQYARAWTLSADVDFDDMYEIADDGRNDWMEVYDKDGDAIGWKLNGESVQRSRLRVDQRKWAASKKAPKKYGDKLDLTVGGGDKPIATISAEMTPEEAARAYHDAIHSDK
jgi:hypothetical protein